MGTGSQRTLSTPHSCASFHEFTFLRQTGMAALAAKRVDKQMKEYYERKTKDGKNGMLVMNALRCKIISRVFATVKRATPYVDFLKYSA